MIGQQCGNCRYYYKKDGDSYAQCRFLPPVRKESGFSEQPIVYSFGWCGQWKPQEASDELKVAADKLEEKGCPQQWTDELKKWHG